MLLNKNSSFVAFGGVSAAISLVCLIAASSLPVCRLAFVFVSSVVVGVMMCAYGNRLAAVQYGAVAILALIFLPNKPVAVLYTVVVGNYPFVKRRLESISSRLLKIIVKVAVYNAYMLICYAIAMFLLNIDMTVGYSLPLLWAGMLVAFAIYDYIYMPFVIRTYNLINKV